MKELKAGSMVGAWVRDLSCISNLQLEAIDEMQSYDPLFVLYVL